MLVGTGLDWVGGPWSVSEDDEAGTDLRLRNSHGQGWNSMTVVSSGGWSWWGFSMEVGLCLENKGVIPSSRGMMGSHLC